MKRVWDKFLLDVGTNTYVLTFYAACAVSGLWFLLYSYIVASKAVIKTRAYQTLFPFIRGDSLDKPGLDVLVGLCANSAFSTVTKAFHRLPFIATQPCTAP